jgi:Helix-hairpin-helix domain
LGGQNAVLPEADDSVAALLDEHADLMVLNGGDPFRARVYHKVIRAIAGHPQDVTTNGVAASRCTSRVHAVDLSHSSEAILARRYYEQRLWPTAESAPIPPYNSRRMSRHPRP